MNTLIDKITLEHLKYSINIAHYNQRGFLNSIDTEAENRRYREELRPIPPSYLGMKILELSEENLVEDSDPEFKNYIGILFSMGDDLEKAATKARQILQTKKSGTFLWAAVRSVATLYAANCYTCPYMPQPWLEEYFKEKRGLPPNLKQEYWDSILAQIQTPLDGELLKILHFAFHQLKFSATENLILIVGAFLEKAKESELKEKVKEWEKGMSPDVINALKGIDF